EIGPVEWLGGPAPWPPHRPLAGELLEYIQGPLDRVALVLELVHRHLDIGMAHEFPAAVARRGRDARIALANLGIDRERRPDAEAPERGVQTPEADAHPVLVPAPVRHVGKERHAGRRRERLSRHRTLDLPDLDIEDGPDHEPGIRRKAQGSPIAGGR